MSTTEEAKVEEKESDLDEHMPGYLGDTEVAKTRAPKTRVLKSTQLTAWEKCRFNDLAEEWQAIQLLCKREQVKLTLDSRNEFLKSVFELWHSGSKQGTEKPRLISGKINESSFHAG